jgi:hypothetical protein
MIFSKPFWTFSKILDHFQNFSFLKTIFLETLRTIVSWFLKTLKNTFFKNSYFWKQSSTLTFLRHFLWLLTIITKSQKTPQKLLRWLLWK